MKAIPTAVFPHRGLAPHQFTPMSGAHKPAAPNAAITSLFKREHHWRGIGAVGCSLTTGCFAMLEKETTMMPPNQPAAPNPAIASRLNSGHHWRGVGEPER